MKIKMLQTMKGSEDGININEYKEGQEYDVNAALGNVFVDIIRCAQVVDGIPEEKAMPAPDNKMAPIPENKEDGDEEKIIGIKRKK